jgi:hypothetical protein
VGAWLEGHSLTLLVIGDSTDMARRTSCSCCVLSSLLAAGHCPTIHVAGPVTIDWAHRVEGVCAGVAEGHHAVRLQFCHITSHQRSEEIS